MKHTSCFILGFRGLSFDESLIFLLRVEVGDFPVAFSEPASRRVFSVSKGGALTSFSSSLTFISNSFSFSSCFKSVPSLSTFFAFDSGFFTSFLLTVLVAFFFFVLLFGVFPLFAIGLVGVFCDSPEIFTGKVADTFGFVFSSSRPDNGLDSAGASAIVLVSSSLTDRIFSVVELCDSAFFGVFLAFLFGVFFTLGVIDVAAFVLDRAFERKEHNNGNIL